MDANFDLGFELTRPASDDAYGDFLTMAFVDAATQDALAIDWSVGGGLTVDSIQARLGAYGLTYSHAGLVRSGEGSLAALSGLAGIASPAEEGADWFGYWEIFRNSAENPTDTTAMWGGYGGQAHWIVLF